MLSFCQQDWSDEAELNSSTYPTHGLQNKKSDNSTDKELTLNLALLTMLDVTMRLDLMG